MFVLMVDCHVEAISASKKKIKRYIKNDMSEKERIVKERKTYYRDGKCTTIICEPKGSYSYYKIKEI